MALGHLIFGNDSGAELAAMLGLDLTKWASRGVDKLTAVTGDLTLLLAHH